MTYGSCHRMCESNVHTWVEAVAESACFESSITRDAGGVRLQDERRIPWVSAILGEAEVDLVDSALGRANALVTTLERV